MSKYNKCAFDDVKPNSVADVQSKFSTNFFSGDVEQYGFIYLIFISCEYRDESFRCEG